MANLVMCYDLMEEQLSEKLKAISAKFGFSSENEEEDDITISMKPKIKPVNNIEQDYADDRGTSSSKQDFSDDENRIYTEPTKIDVRSRNDDEEERNIVGNLITPVKSQMLRSGSQFTEKKSTSNIHKDLSNLRFQSKETSFQFPTPLS